MERSAAKHCSSEHVREAAVWLALLRAPERTSQLEAGFRRWLSESAAHRHAFETVSTAWEGLGALAPSAPPRLSRWQRAGYRQGFLYSATALAALVLMAVLGVFFYVQQMGVATGIGEQRLLVLEDGTRVYLNTDTRVVVDYDRQRRLVYLKRGEALFEVAKRGPKWPFMVRANDQTITALGTSFLVRQETRQLAVTLLEGSITVANTETAHASAVKDGEAGGEAVRPVVMTAGERLTSESKGIPVIDHPPVEQLTAWRSGRVNLDKVTLAAAATEMNRYSQSRLVVQSPRAAAIEITGIFRAGDTLNFANAVASTYGLQVAVDGDVITLLGAPGGEADAHARQ